MRVANTRHRKVSIIIPTLNEEKYIEKTLHRLSKIEDIEIIIVDGNSEDRTVELAKRFTNKIYIINRRGIARARNFGAKNATGEILIFLDADVIVPLDFIEKVSAIFNDKDVVGATCSIMPLNPKIAERVFFIFYNTLIRILSLLHSNMFKFARGEFIAVRKKDFEAIGGFNEELPCVEDHDLSLRISKRGKFVFIKDLTVYESLRRVRKWGLPKTVKVWLLDFIIFIVSRKTYSKIWSPVR